jgi:hypothetical protein
MIAARNALEALEAQREAVPSVPIPSISDSQPRLQGVPA